ncbi:MAG TPA: hypothetical protein VIT45_16270 [Allosphingosinicella sp.]
MNRLVLRASLASACLLLLAGCGDGADGENGAKVADTKDQFGAAADALAAKLAAPGAPPAADDPAVKAFEAESERALTALGTPSLPIRGFDSYDDLCGKAVKVVGAWAALGTGNMSESAKAEAMNRNVTAHIDTIFTPLLFSAHCTAMHMPFLEESMTTADLGSKKDAIEQVRGGAYQQVNGLLEMAGAPDLAEERKTKIVDMLAADSGKFAVVLNADQRKAIGDAAVSIKAALPEQSRAKADAIQIGFAQAPCGKLCTF